MLYPKLNIRTSKEKRLRAQCILNYGPLCGLRKFCPCNSGNLGNSSGCESLVRLAARFLGMLLRLQQTSVLG